MKLTNGMKVIAPSGCEDYLTEGKEYEVFDVELYKNHGYFFIIIDDDGDRLPCLFNDCRHLNGGNWIIKQEKKLKSMREFCLANSDKNSIEYKEAFFQSQQPNIGMFVPAVCENNVWRVLEKPEQYEGALEFAIGEDFEEAYQYQQAQSKVIFKGWEYKRKMSDLKIIESELTVIKSNLYDLYFDLEHNECHIDTPQIYRQIHTLEDLVKFNLEKV